MCINLLKEKCYILQYKSCVEISSLFKTKSPLGWADKLEKWVVWTHHHHPFLQQSHHVISPVQKCTIVLSAPEAELSLNLQLSRQSTRIHGLSKSQKASSHTLLSWSQNRKCVWAKQRQKWGDKNTARVTQWMPLTIHLCTTISVTMAENILMAKPAFFVCYSAPLLKNLLICWTDWMTAEKGKRLGHMQQQSKNKAEWKSPDKHRVVYLVQHLHSQLLDAIRVSVRPDK